MKAISRALGRIVARSAGEDFVYVRASGELVPVRGPVSRQPPEIDTEGSTGFTTLSGSFALPMSFFEDVGWLPQIGVDSIRLQWDGQERDATVTQQLGASNSMLVFGVTLST